MASGRRIDDDDLAALSDAERRVLARRLAVLIEARPQETAVTRHRRHLFLNLVVVCCAALIPWIVLLALTLPRRYAAGHWTAAWVGFDVLLLSGLAVTGWAAWRRRQLIILAAQVTGTLLVTDAWFDVLLSRNLHDTLVSLASAVVVELPLAGVLFWVSRRMVRLTTRTARLLAGDDVLDPPFWKVPLFAVDEPEPGAPFSGRGRRSAPA